MRARVDDERLLLSISSVALSAYLEQHEWTLKGRIPGRSAVYSREEGGKRWGIQVPERDTFPDHAESIARSIETIAEVEQRTELEIYRALAGTGADTINITALHAPDAAHLSFHDAGHLLNDSYRLVAAAARAAERPRPAFRGRASAAVTTFLNSISPAPLVFDAFALTLFSPVPLSYGQARLPNNGGGLQSAPVPFSRRAVAGLASGLGATAQAIVDVRTQDDLAPFDDAVHSGVSANLCSALLGLMKLSGEFGGGITVDVRWAATRPRNGKQTASIPFSAHEVEIVQAAGNRLRAGAFYPDEQVLADVVRLEREPEEFDGHAQLLAEIDDHSRRLSVTFDPTDFHTVITAFQEHRQIELDGDLHPAGRGYELRNPHNVRLLEDPAE